MTASDPRLRPLLDWAHEVFRGRAGLEPPDVEARGDAVRAVLADQLSDRQPAALSGDDTWPLGGADGLTIELCHRTPRAAAAPILTDVRPVAWLTLRDGDRLWLQRFRSAGIAHPDVFDPAARLVAAGDRECCELAVCLPGAEPLAHVLTVAAPMPLLRILGAATHLFAWRFDPHTLQAIAVMPIDSTPGRLALMLDYFRCSGDPAGAAVAEQLLQHPVHFVRWKAMQLLAAHEPGRTRSLLQGMHADPHPTIRSTAGRLLEAGD